MDSGADMVVTQAVFSAADYSGFVADCRDAGPPARLRRACGHADAGRSRSVRARVGYGRCEGAATGRRRRT